MSLNLQEIAQAVQENKPLQRKDKGYTKSHWSDMDSGQAEINLEKFEYRIKPATRDIWVFYVEGEIYPIMFWTQVGARSFFEDKKRESRFFTFDVWKNCEEPDKFDSVPVDESNKSPGQWEQIGTELDAAQFPYYTKKAKLPKNRRLLKLRDEMSEVCDDYEIYNTEYSSYQELGRAIDFEEEEIQGI